MIETLCIMGGTAGLSKQPPRGSARAFTLIELLVVVAIIAILASMILPALVSAKHAGKKARCISNLRQIGIAIQNYAIDYDGNIPFGPKAPPFTSPADFYPSTGAPTSLITLRGGAPVGLGLMLREHLALQPKVVFCPGTDQPLDAEAELARASTNQAQSSYYYRHAGNTQLFDSPTAPFVPSSIRLANLGLNRSNAPITALVMDSIFLCPPDLANFNVRPRTHHQEKFANTLYHDGSAQSLKNGTSRYTVDVRDYAQLRSTFDLILRTFETADSH